VRGGIKNMVYELFMVISRRYWWRMRDEEVWMNHCSYGAMPRARRRAIKYKDLARKWEDRARRHKGWVM